jgi:hypothetical protein
MTTPKEVVVPSGSPLVRFYGGGAGPDGAWWWTSWELHQLADHLGHLDFASGLGSQGSSVLHKAGVVLGSWSTAASFRVIELRQPFSAFFGEGDGAEWTREVAGQPRSSYLKGLRIFGPGGGQRYLRQLFLPSYWSYSAGAREKCSGATDSQFAGELMKLPRAMLPFEA